MMWKLQPPPPEALKHHHPIFNLCSGERRPVSDCVAQTYASSRWCPTPEQLRALEEFYRRGIRTPSTYQIQQITAQLRRYGKIEGKNVFYWFQNHKARERQRLRRRLSSSASSSEPKSSKDVQVIPNKTTCPTMESVTAARVEKDGWIQQLLLHTQTTQNNNNGDVNPINSNLMILTSNSSSSCATINDHNSSYTASSFQAPRPNKTLELFPLRCDDKGNGDEDEPVEFYEFL